MTDFRSRVHTTEYAIGDIVFLRLRDERRPGMITGIQIRPGHQTFGVSWGDGGNETWHFSMELSREYVPDFGGAE